MARFLSLWLACSLFAMPVSAFAQQPPTDPPPGGGAEEPMVTCQDGTKHPANCICLLEPLPGGQSVICPENNNPLAIQGIFQEYFGLVDGGGVFTWALGTGVAMVLLNIVAGAYQIMFSNGDQGMIGKGKTRIFAAIGGLLVLMFAGVILNFINPQFFTL